MKRILPLLIVLLLAASAYAGDPIYKCTDKDGKVTYTTKPGPNMDCKMLPASAPEKEEPEKKPKAQKRKPKQRQKLLRISAEQLYDHFEENGLAADEQFKNKIFIVYGKISDISQIFGKPYLTLEAGFSSARVVQCMFDKEDKKSLLSLSKGQTVSVKGVCRGMTLTIVAMGDCRLR